MVNSDFYNKALTAIHECIIQAKIMAVKSKPAEEIYYFLDETEYLSILLLDEKDNTDEFLKQIMKISDKYNLPYISSNFKD